MLLGFDMSCRVCAFPEHDEHKRFLLHIYFPKCDHFFMHDLLYNCHLHQDKQTGTPKITDCRGHLSKELLNDKIF